jgi:hypothetical protein
MATTIDHGSLGEHPVAVVERDGDSLGRGIEGQQQHSVETNGWLSWAQVAQLGSAS